jgi:uncharacterized protein (DUF1697 family)
MNTRTNPGSAYVALLRGINLGKRKLPMKDLAAVFAESKCGNVQTYIQSGNVVFTASSTVAKKLCPVVEKKIEERFGFSAPIVLRSREQIAQVVRANPFLKAGKPEQTLYVYFLADEPGAEAKSRLDPNRSPGDEFRVIGSEIYLYLPGGMANSKLTNAYFDSKLSTIATFRNWATVNKLLEMMAALG